ncbi:protein DBF4 homolog B [Sylvia atricapilla]|uniref:protein DBF4 homolog B n=1 Tax=Sylvia atricapilla TaxID=48155 RepID=UPI003390A0F4
MAGTASSRPLRGQSFYLDLPSGRSARELAEAIGRLGGVTESFLSKEVTCVVSSNREAKRGQARPQEEKQSSPTAKGTKSMSSVPAAPTRRTREPGNPTKPRQKPPYTALLSRGKELLHKAMKNQDTCSGSSILANARLWGVQILHVDEMLSYAQQLLRAISGARKQCQKTEVKCPASRSKIHRGKLKPPFLKVEDQSRQFRPFHHQFQSFPDLNFLAPKSSSPFEPLKSLSNSCQARGAEGCALRSAGGKSPHVTVPRKRRGFCECCQETFEELQKHLQSLQHQQFAQDNSQYILVDRVISQLTNSFVEWSAEVPWACLAEERAVPQAHSTGGIKLLPTELGKEGEQPEQGAVELVTHAELDHGLKTKGHPPCLPRDRLRDPRGGGSLSEHSSLRLPGGAGLSRGLCAAHGTMGEAGLEASGLGLAPELGWGPHAAPAPVRETVPSSEPHTQPGSVSHPPQAQPASRKRQLCSTQSPQVGKRPRLELGFGLSPLGEQTELLVGGGMGAQGAGQVSEPGLPLGTELSNRPHSSLALDLCLCESPGDPVSQPGSLGAVAAGFDPGEAAAAGTVSKHGWSKERSQGKQRRGDSDNTPSKGKRPCLESTVSRTSCPAGCLPSPTLPVAEARCCCSLRVRAAEEAAPGAPHIPRQGTEPRPPPACCPEAAHGSSRSSSESHWAVQLLPRLTGVQGRRIPPGDKDLLQQTHVSVRDSRYESQLCSVLKESELAWAGQGDKSCRNCCTETRGASFPIFGT